MHKPVKHLVSFWSAFGQTPHEAVWYVCVVQELGGDMGNATAHQRLASHIKACEQQMSCVYARTAAEAKQIERRVAAGSLEVVMPGLYARPEYWSELKFRQRYLHRVRALAQKHPDWTFCSYTAAAICGLSVSYANLTHIHIAVMPTQSTTPGSKIVRHRYIRRTRASEMDIAVTDIDQTITDCLVDASFVEGLIIADSVLHEQLMSKKHLIATVDELGRGRRGVAMARWVAQQADGLSESGGESKARALMIERGWQVPELQVELPDPVEPGGVYRVDYLWRVGDRLIIGEFDGFIKSEKAAAEGKLAKAQFDERQRESRLTMLDSCKVVRLCWDDLKDPTKLDRKLKVAGVPRVG